MSISPVSPPPLPPSATRSSTGTSSRTAATADAFRAINDTATAIVDKKKISTLGEVYIPLDPAAQATADEET